MVFASVVVGVHLLDYAIDRGIDDLGNLWVSGGVETMTLHLILTHHWYDEIESGRKSVEYRSNTRYWRTRILNFLHQSDNTVTFHRGYTSTTMQFKVKKLVVPATRFQYCPDIQIHLGDRI